MTEQFRVVVLLEGRACLEDERDLSLADEPREDLVDAPDHALLRVLGRKMPVTSRGFQLRECTHPEGALRI